MPKRVKISEGTEIAEGRFPTVDLPISPPYPPMEAKRVEEIPDGDGWQYEPKWDGFRAIVFRDGATLAIQSKAGQPLDRYFPELADAFLRLDAESFILDGEIVVPVGGRLSFDDLLQRIHPAASRVRKLSEESPARFFAFDLLAGPGRTGAISHVQKSLAERRKLLEDFVARNEGAPSIQISPATEDRRIAGQWFEKFGSIGLDGVMAKRTDQPYHSGDREGMVKVKHLKTADCVVGGFRYAAAGRAIGSLLLGLYDDDRNLVFIGHTSSFKRNEKTELKEIVEPLVSENPFSVRVPGGPSRWASERSSEWVPVKPNLVCEVEYDYFSQKRFRHGSRFIRWRPEKKPAQCKMDQVDPRQRKGTLKEFGL